MMDDEKMVCLSKGAVMLDFEMKDATSILCQAMFDETLRLRSCWSRKEKDSIRKFLIESYQLLLENMTDRHNPKEHLDGTKSEIQQTNK